MTRAEPMHGRAALILAVVGLDSTTRRRIRGNSPVDPVASSREVLHK
jgi:hypothetical protein